MHPIALALSEIHDFNYAEKQSPEIYQKQRPSVPSTQQAAITLEVGPALNQQIRTIEVRAPSQGEAVVRILYTGICRSDASFCVGPKAGFPKYNHIGGHEGIGRIVQAHDHSLLGRLVGIRYLARYCRTCCYCLRGLPTSCPEQLNAAKNIPGTFQQYITLSTSSLLELPAYLQAVPSCKLPSYAAALCSGSAALMALRAANTMPGDVVVILGILGAIGHMAGAMAKHVFGLKVIGVDIVSKLDSSLPVAASEYADVFLPAYEEGGVQAWPDYVATIHNAFARLLPATTGKRAGDAVIVASSRIGAFRSLDEYVCDGGRIVCSGVPQGSNNLILPLNRLVERSLTVSGTLMGGDAEVFQVMQYIHSGCITPMITCVGLEGIPDSMRKLVDCQVVGKIVVSMLS